MQKRVLIVGDSPGLGLGSRPSAEGENSGWSFQIARAGLEALTALRQTEYCAIVTRESLPGGICGSALLDEVHRRHPRLLRFLQTDLRDKRTALKSIGTAHHLLMGSGGIDSLKQAIEKALALEVWLPTEKVQNLLLRLRQIPSPPSLYFTVATQLQSATASLEDIGETISRDPAMTAKLLQLVNSAVFGLRFQVGHPGEALAYLGVEATKSLILMAHTFSHFDVLEQQGFSVTKLWQHCLMTARAAQWIAESEGAGRELPAQAFTAGLLHDIGQLLLAANLPSEFKQAFQRTRAEPVELWRAERDVFGVHHGELGACLLAIWGLPNPIIEAVGLHHQPIQLAGTAFTSLTAVHAANAWARAADPDGASAARPQHDLDYLLSCGCADRASEWHRVLSERAEAMGAACSA